MPIEQELEEVALLFLFVFHLVRRLSEHAQPEAITKPEVVGSVNLPRGGPLAGGLRVGINGDAQAGFLVGDGIVTEEMRAVVRLGAEFLAAQISVEGLYRNPRLA